MQVDCFHGRSRKAIFITLPHGTDPATLQDAAVQGLVKEGLVPQKLDFNLERSDNRIGVDASKLIDDINAKGFALHAAKIETTVDASFVPR